MSFICFRCLLGSFAYVFKQGPESRFHIALFISISNADETCKLMTYLHYGQEETVNGFILRPLSVHSMVHFTAFKRLKQIFLLDQH